MAYLSSTSSSPNCPALVIQGLAYSSSNVTGVAGPGNGQPRIWTYSSTHASSDVTSAYFFTDGRALGFQLGDVLFAYTSTFAVVSVRCIANGSTTVQFSAATTLASS